jgi:hypothetical protein
MSIELETALISASVALIIALVSMYISLWREQRQPLIDLKTAYETERYKTRLASYPRAFEILEKISHGSAGIPTPEIALQVAYELNVWFYSVGGMCAEVDTRGAILELRGCCFRWGNEGVTPEHLYDWRNAAMLLLRRDLDLEGLESRDMDKIKPLLKKVQSDITKI